MTTEPPPGVTRSRDILPTVTLDTCAAVQFHLKPRGNEAARSVIIWRHGPKHVRPQGGKRVRDVRPGDVVKFQGRDEQVIGVEIYR